MVLTVRRTTGSRNYNHGNSVVNSPQQCPKCGGGMEQGFMIDDLGHASRLVSHWAAGAPVKSFWAGIQLAEDTLLPIGTYRCASCGFLESYARPEFAPK